MTPTRIPETNKKSGVHYAFTDEGLELPIVDVTHPAFALSLTEAEQRARVVEFARQPIPFAQLPRFLRTMLLDFFMRGSVLWRGLRRAQGTFLSGMQTYLLKLGPDNLGSFATPIDRRIAAALPALSVRLRLQDTAQLLAAAVAPALTVRGRPLHLIVAKLTPNGPLGGR